MQVCMIVFVSRCSGLVVTSTVAVSFLCGCLPRLGAVSVTMSVPPAVCPIMAAPCGWTP